MPTYSDKNNSTYVHPVANKDLQSPVSNPGGNPNLDESYRGSDDASFRPQFSNLDNTYMFSTNGHKARHRFWGEYANSHSYMNGNADIDDPIFTGFTLSIDKLSSPLFFTIGDYDGLASGRTRNDGSQSVRNIADEIENCLSKNYSTYIRGAVNSYELKALITKDKFPDGGSVGSGMQNNIYVDGIPYGATEYIYMVDKYVKDVGSSQDVGGNYSLGDGSKTTSASDVQSRDDLEEQKALLEGQIKALEDKLGNADNKDAHDEIEKNKSDIEAELQQVQASIEEARKKINALSATENTDYKAAFESAVKEKFTDLLARMKAAVVDLKPTGGNSTHSQQQYETICNTINTLDNKLMYLVNLYNNNASGVQQLLPDIPTTTAEVTSCTVHVDARWNDDAYRTLPLDDGGTFDGMQAYGMGARWDSLKVEVGVSGGSSGGADLDNLKKELENLESREQELRNELQTATKKSQDDTYSQDERELETLRENLKRVQTQLNQYRNDDLKSNDGESSSVGADGERYTGDKHAGVEDDQTAQNENKAKLPMAPQTVYDMLSFIRGMTRLTTEYPYLLQSITGLDEVYKNNYGVKDSLRGSKDNKITINIYETLDLKVSGMFDKYFNAAYDAQYRRERVPVNLRRFNCSVFVHDIRNFHMMSTQLGGLIRSAGEKNIPKIVEVALNTMSAIEFKFYGCEIVPEETGGIFESVTNADRGEMRMTKFSFTYSDCVINYLPFEDLKRNLLKKLKSGGHTPSVSVNKGTNKDRKDLKYGGGIKVYKMKASRFDESKPKLNGLSNVYTDNPGKALAEDEIRFRGELEGLDGHSTVPQKAGIVPGGYAGKINYTLSSNLGNVNANDKVSSGSVSEGSAEPHLKGIDATVGANNMVAGIGNVNDNDKNENLPKGDYEDKTKSQSQLVGIRARMIGDTVVGLGNVNLNDRWENTPADNSSTLDPVKHSYYDRNMFGGYNHLGNVNNDDYDEFRNRRLNEDRPVVMKDKRINGAAAYEAINSSNENLRESRREFELLFNHLATSVSASIGRERENVYRSYLDEIEHVVFPGNNTDVVEDINYNASPNSENTTPNIDSAQLSGINAVSANGYVKRLGNVNANDSLESTPDVEEQTVTVNGTNTSVSNGIVESLGDVLDDGYQGSTIQMIGDVMPDDNLGPTYENLGNVYPEQGATITQRYIGDVLPDDLNNLVVETIENIYPETDEPDTQGYIEDVLPDDQLMPNVKNIGNVYPVIKEPKTQGYIEDVMPDEKLGKPIEKLDNVYPKKDPLAEPNGNVEKLGNINPKQKASEILNKLDKLSEKKSKRKVIEDLGIVK